MSEDNPLDFLVSSPSGKLMEEGPIFKSDDIFQKDISALTVGILSLKKSSM